MIRGCYFLIPIASCNSCAEPRPRAVCKGSRSRASGSVALTTPPPEGRFPEGTMCWGSRCLQPWLSPFPILVASGLKYSESWGPEYCPHMPNFPFGSIRGPSRTCWPPYNTKSEHSKHVPCWVLWVAKTWGLQPLPPHAQRSLALVCTRKRAQFRCLRAYLCFQPSLL